MSEPRRDDARPQGERSIKEEFRVSGEAVVATVKDLVREGNVRRIAIKNDEGRVLLEIPLTIGVIGTVLLPVWAALGAMAALVANLTIAVERVEPKGEASHAAPPETAARAAPTSASAAETPPAPTENTGPQEDHA